MRTVPGLLAVLMIFHAELAAGEGLWPDDRPTMEVDDGLPPLMSGLDHSGLERSADPSPPAPDGTTWELQRNPERVFDDGPSARLAPVEPDCQISLGAYGWLPEMYGQVGIRDVTTELAVTTREELNLIEHNLHFLFAGQMEAECGPWAAFASGLYMYAGFGTSIRRLSFSANSSLAIVDAALAHELEGLAETLGLPPGSKFELLAGGRYWLLGGSVTVTGPRGRSATRGNDVDWVDPVVGARFTYACNPTMRFRIRGDVGGFSWFKASDDTWNVETVIEKRCSKCCTIAAGYRILDVDYTRDSSQRFVFDAQLRGPVTTLSLEF